MKDIPERIWLQPGEPHDLVESFHDLPMSEVSWCSDQIDEHDIEYVRADLYERLRVENARLHLALFHVENGLSHPDARVRALIETAEAAKEDRDA